MQAFEAFGAARACFELLGYLLAAVLVSLGFVVWSLKHYRLMYPTARDSTRAIFRDYLAWQLVGCRDLLGGFLIILALFWII